MRNQELIVVSREAKKMDSKKLHNKNMCTATTVSLFYIEEQFLQSYDNDVLFHSITNFCPQIVDIKSLYHNLL